MAEPARIYAPEPDEIAERKPVLQLVVRDNVNEGGVVTEPNVSSPWSRSSRTT